MSKKKEKETAKEQLVQQSLFEEKMEFQSLDYIMSDRFGR